jgi:hypothetical protein
MRVVREEMLEIAETVNTDKISKLIKTGAAGLLSEHKHNGKPSQYDTGLISAPAFAELPMPQIAAAAITVRIGGCAIDMQNGADPAMVEQVLRFAARL